MELRFEERHSSTYLVVVVVVVVGVVGFVVVGNLDEYAGGELVIQQLPSSGQWASESTSSQNKANKPPTHSPLQGFSGRGDVGAGLCVVESGRGATVVTTGTVEPLSETAQSKHNTKFDTDFTLDFNLCDNC